MFDRFGADTVRLYMVSDAPPDKMQVWSESGINGAWRLLTRLWTLVLNQIPALSQPGDPIPDNLDATNMALRRKTHQCVMRVTEAIEGGFQFNTAIARCNELLATFRANADKTHPTVRREALEFILRVLSPIVPHFAEELWSKLGNTQSIFACGWPQANADIATEDEVEMPIQINGKIRTRLTFPMGVPQAEVEKAVMDDAEVQKWIEGKTIRKVIVVPNKLVNIAVS
jgi:leucyl-tRNA synthetase